MKEQLINEILEKEWYFFTNTKNTDGMAECQGNKEEFIIMRQAQWEQFSEKTLQHYSSDLDEAYHNNRNLVLEKYLHMMKNSAIDEYNEKKDILPIKSEAQKTLINQITKIYMPMAEIFYKNYPNFTKNCRPLYKEKDEVERVSVETYLYGELSSYSKYTLLYFLDDMKYFEKNDINILYEINNYVSLAKGMGSVENVEKYIEE